MVSIRRYTLSLSFVIAETRDDATVLAERLRRVRDDGEHYQGRSFESSTPSAIGRGGGAASVCEYTSVHSCAAPTISGWPPPIARGSINYPRTV